MKEYRMTLTVNGSRAEGRGFFSQEKAEIRGKVRFDEEEVSVVFLLRSDGCRMEKRGAITLFADFSEKGESEIVVVSDEGRFFLPVRTEKYRFVKEETGAKLWLRYAFAEENADAAGGEQSFSVFLTLKEGA